MIYPVGSDSKIYCIEGAGEARVYFVTEPERVLIDAGAPGQADRIVRDLASLGVRPLDIKKILITHHHENHVGGLWELRKRTGALIMAHFLDADYIAGRKARRISRSGLSRVYSSTVAKLHPVECRPIEPDRLLHDEEEIAGLRVLHTPGHTPGHVCFLRGTALFSGDLLEVGAGSFREGPPSRTADVPAARNSIRRLAALEVMAVLPSHQPPYVFNADKRLRELAARLGGVYE